MLGDALTGLLVVGDVVTDVLARHGAGPASGPAAESDAPADILVRPGGSGANTAAWAARLGGDVRMLARVGDDSGDWHRAQLEGAGVRPYLRTDTGRPTAMIVVMVDPAGERTMLTSRGAGGFLGPGDWDDSLLEGVAHVHVSGYTLFTPPGEELARLAMEKARDAGVTISVDPASTAFLAGFGVRRFVTATAGADVILPNREEAELLTGLSRPEPAARALSAEFGLAVVKLGADGALASRYGRIACRVPGAPVRAVDTTGAGDAFAAGFLTVRLAGGDVPAALAAACAAGAQAVTGMGGRPGIRPRPPE